MPENRTERVNFRMTPDEVAKLRDLAEAEGVSSSDIVRMLVKREHVARFGERAPRKKKPR